MSFNNITREYLERFQDCVRRAHAAGLSSVEIYTRPIVHAYIEKLVGLVRNNVTIHHDTKVRGTSNRPDWRFEDPSTFGVFAYGDQKDLNLDGPFELSFSERVQMNGYIKLGRPLFVFDGIEFLIFEGSLLSPKRYSIVPKPLALSEKWALRSIDSQILDAFALLLKEPGLRYWTDADLVEHLATRARLLSDSIDLLLQSPIGSGSSLAEEELLKCVHELWSLVKENHDPRLHSSRTASDFIAQVLVFGLFYAHVGVPTDGMATAERKSLIESFWLAGGSFKEASKLRPFRAIVEALGENIGVELEHYNDLALWYRDCAALLAHASMQGIQNEALDYHALFERFFTVFDPQERFERGVFYTPSVLAEWIGAVVDSISFGQEGCCVAERADKILDPCCGTGGILEVLLRRGLTVLNPPEYVGFEVLPAPYALAQYRLQNYVNGTRLENHLRLLLVDTLSDDLARDGGQSNNLFDEERQDAIRMTAAPLRVVVGNPPSSDKVVSGASRDIINTLIEDFRPPALLRGARQNIQKALNNEAYRFLRWAAKQVIEANRGLIALVLPDSIMYRASFAWARKWILEQFDEVWVLMVDHDTRGRTGDSLFRVQQGRAVLFAYRAQDHKNGSTGLQYYDIRDRSLIQKEAFLKDLVDPLSQFKRIDVLGDRFIFSPEPEYPREAWEMCWPLRRTPKCEGVFLTKCSGIKLSPSSMLFHTDPLQLKRRCCVVSARDRSGWRHSVDALQDQWWKGQKKPPSRNKFTDAVRESIGNAVSQDSSIVRMSYRPFLDGFVLSDDRVFDALASSPGGGGRRRPEVRFAFQKSAVGIAIAPDPTSIGDSLARIASFVWNLPDNDLAARGNGMIYCDLFPDTSKQKKPFVLELGPNVSPDCISLFEYSESPCRAVTYYVYAILSSSAWLEHFEGALFQAREPDAPIRIPIFYDNNVRERLVELGSRIAFCEHPEIQPRKADGIKACWAGSNTEFRLDSFRISCASGNIDLLDSDGNVWASVSGIAPELLELRISGHEVVSKWLRERKFSYLRRTFQSKDLDALVNVLARMSEQRSLIDEVDLIIAPLLSEFTSNLVPPP